MCENASQLLQVRSFLVQGWIFDYLWFLITFSLFFFKFVIVLVFVMYFFQILYLCFQLFNVSRFVDMFTLYIFDIFCIDCPHFFSVIILPLICCCIFFTLTPSTLHSVLLPLGVLLFKCLLSMHMRCAPIYIHKAGSMCFLPTITSASPQLVMMQFLKCLSFFCFDFFDFELVICASMINVLFGGN